MFIVELLLKSEMVILGNRIKRNVAFDENQSAKFCPFKGLNKGT